MITIPLRLVVMWLSAGPELRSDILELVRTASGEYTPESRIAFETLSKLNNISGLLERAELARSVGSKSMSIITDKRGNTTILYQL